MKACILILCITLLGAVCSAQTRTITNFDLEKYKTERVAAEKDLNENYAKLGFASPEERAKRLEAWKKESQDLADKLEMERLARENAEAISQQAAAQQRFYQSGQQGYPVYDNGSNYSSGYGYGVGYGVGYGYRRGYSPNFRVPQQQGYYAGGAFWPTGPSTPPRPLFVIRPRQPRH